MKYEGKLYGKINGKYVEMTETVNDLEAKIERLQGELEQTEEYRRLALPFLYI